MNHKSNAMLKQFLAGPYLLWMTGFTVIPLILIVGYGLTDQDGAFTAANLMSIATAEHSKAFFLSVGLSFLSMAISFLIAWPLALALRMKGVGMGSFAAFVFILPMWMNFLLRTMAWQTLLEKNGVINGILDLFHLPNIAIINTPWAIVLGMVYNFLPFMILPIYNSLAKIDNELIDVARDLGADVFQTIFRIWLPLSVPGIVSGAVMVFVPSLSTFITSNLLGGGKILLIGNVIEQEFSFGNNWNLGSGLSLVLMIFILLSMLLASRYDKENGGRRF